MKIDYGIQSITFAKLAAGGAFPDFATSPDKMSVQLIDVDSFEMAEEDNQTQDVEFEDVDPMTLSGTKGKKIITFTSSDKRKEILKFFKGMTEGTTTDVGWLIENPNHDDTGTFALQIITRAMGSFPAKTKQYTPVLTTVKETGTIGKNNLGKLTFTCVRQPNFDATGKPIRGFREKEIPVV